MIAVDTGFLFALVDRRDRWHEAAAALRSTANEGWITTWPVLTEACHLFQRFLGVRFAQALMEDVSDGGLRVWPIPNERMADIPVLMKRYGALPMDLADASLVLLAEDLGHGRILSTDQRDFKAYRWKSRRPFQNLMETPA